MAQLPCIYAIVLVARFQQRVLARVAYDHFSHVRLEQVVQPGGTGAFLERYPQSSLQSLEKFQDGSCFRFDQRLHYQFSAGVPDCNGYACLSTSMPIYFVLSIGVLLSAGPEPTY